MQNKESARYTDPSGIRRTELNPRDRDLPYSSKKPSVTGDPEPIVEGEKFFNVGPDGKITVELHKVPPLSGAEGRSVNDLVKHINNGNVTLQQLNKEIENAKTPREKRLKENLYAIMEKQLHKKASEGIKKIASEYKSVLSQDALGKLFKIYSNIAKER